MSSKVLLCRRVLYRCATTAVLFWYVLDHLSHIKTWKHFSSSRVGNLQHWPLWSLHYSSSDLRWANIDSAMFALGFHWPNISCFGSAKKTFIYLPQKHRLTAVSWQVPDLSDRRQRLGENPQTRTSWSGRGQLRLVFDNHLQDGTLQMKTRKNMKPLKMLNQNLETSQAVLLSLNEPMSNEK